jgi:putative membrane protein insertion efficiency factor
MIKKVLIACIRFYQKFLSPLKTRPTCIFYPTCSQYAVEAIQKHGVFRGGLMAAWRILRCNPFNRHGGYDPVK